MAERQSGCKIKTFTLDGGSEFINSLFGPFCDEHGISIHQTASYTPEQNGVAERSKKTINAKARALLIASNLPSKFWWYAVLLAVFLTNRTICKASGDLKTTPYEIWHKRKPIIRHLRTFGCAVQILIRKELRGGKFEPVSRDGVLLGFSDDNFNFIVLDLVTNKIVISHDVHFQESTFPFRKEEPIHVDSHDDSHWQQPQHDQTPATHPQADEDDEPITLPTTPTDV